MALAAAPAAANDVQWLRIESDPQFDANPAVDVTFDGGHLTVTNPTSNSVVITEINGKLVDPATFSNFNGSGANPQGRCAIQPFTNTPNDKFTCFVSNPESNRGGVEPGHSATFTYQLSDPAAALDYLEVVFSFADIRGGCRPGFGGGFASDLRSSPVAVTADACTPPSHTRITEAQIHKQKHTASFRFKANGAHKFDCELIRNRKIKFHHSCGSPKRYTNRLPKGKYKFLVWGVNSGGADPLPAIKNFKLG
jgi:hypothetical protein